MDFVRVEIARRNFCLAKYAKAKAQASRLLRASEEASSPALRAALLERACVATRSAAGFIQTADGAGKNARNALALLDPASPQSLENAKRIAALHARMAEFRANRVA